jgi:ABC-type dipeptide/oligopeptide/nickel transport system ATPase component
LSREQLLLVESSRALEATKRFDQLTYYHVPFDQLNGDERTEATLTRLVGNGDRVAVVGASGCGKSSLLASVLGPLAENLPGRIVPMRVPIAAEADATVTDPGSMARHLVRYITRWASPERFSDDERHFFEGTVAEATRRSGPGGTREFHIGLPLWLARAEFASQVQSIGTDYESRGMAADAVEALRRLVALFASHELYPILVFEDSDAWLNIPGLDRSQVANAFFMRTIRMLAKEVDAGLVVAVHEEYLALEGYKVTSGLLSGEIHVPRLINARDGIDAILRDRMTIAEVGVPIEAVIEDEAIAWLAKYYETGKQIRDVLSVAQRSVQHSLSDGMETVTEQLVDQAIAESER